MSPTNHSVVNMKTEVLLPTTLGNESALTFISLAILGR